MSGRHGLTKGLTNYGDPEFAAYLRRSFAKSMGYSKEMLDRPIIGIATSASGFNNCHRSVPELVDAVKRGVLGAGGLPIEFPTISLGEVFLKPTSFVFRNLMAMDVEEMIRAQPMSAVVLVGGCDKTGPAQLMGAISAGVPAIQLVVGPMMTGRYRGERLGACTDCRRFWARYRAGDMTQPEIAAVEDNLAVTAGTCSVMGTASTMACLSEVLGLCLPGSAAVPAVHADRLRVAEATGVEAMQLAESGTAPGALITRQSLDNALSESTPVLVNLKPTGEHYMEDFHAAGGVGAVLDELKPLLHLECRDVTGQTLEERLQHRPAFVDPAVIRSTNEPFHGTGSLVALFGNLAPNGSILKCAAADARLFEHVGRAVVFKNLDDLSARIDDPSLDVEPDDVLVLQHAGPIGAGMPEAGYLPIPAKLARAGVKDMVRISDARMSGTAFGTVILHASPECATGGPLGLVRSGDRIRVSVNARTIDVLLSEQELDSRRQTEAPPKPQPVRGYARLYAQHVLGPELGCDFDFLRQPQ